MKEEQNRTDKAIKIHWISNFIVVVVVYILTTFLANSFRIAQVQGNSMNPTIYDGDIVIVSAITECEDQDIIIINTEGTEICVDSIIKRYYEDKSDDLSVWVEGDNKNHSLDSRKLGTFEKERIIGVAIFDLTQFKRLR